VTFWTVLHVCNSSNSVCPQAAEQNNIDPSIVNVQKKNRKRKAPAPPNPFTGEVEEQPPTEEEDVHEHDEEELGVTCPHSINIVTGLAKFVKTSFPDHKTF